MQLDTKIDRPLYQRNIFDGTVSILPPRLPCKQKMMGHFLTSFPALAADQVTCLQITGKTQLARDTT